MTHPITSLEFYRQKERSALMAEDLSRHDVQVDNIQASIITSMFGDLVLGSALKTYWRPNGDVDENIYNAGVRQSQIMNVVVSSFGTDYREELYVSTDRVAYGLLGEDVAAEVKARSFDLDPDSLKAVHGVMKASAESGITKAKETPQAGDLIIAQKIAEHDSVERVVINRYGSAWDEHEPSITGFNINGKTLLLKEQPGWGWRNVRITPAEGEDILVPTFDRVTVSGGGEKIESHEPERITKAIVNTLVELSTK